MRTLSNPAGKRVWPTFHFYPSRANGTTDASVLSGEDIIALV
jgi:hypothetical protein